MELETQLQIALRLRFVNRDEASALLIRTDGVGKMLSGLRKSISTQSE